MNESQKEYAKHMRMNTSWMASRMALVDEVYTGNGDPGILANQLEVLSWSDLGIWSVQEDGECVKNKLYFEHAGVDVKADLLDTGKWTSEQTYGLGIEIPTAKGPVYVVIPDIRETHRSELLELTNTIKKANFLKTAAETIDSNAKHNKSKIAADNVYTKSN